ncbi:hypothetical protein [Sporolactobacillus spathodeae]|uniref:hypothetical protein n=1 Tax=Sporolactobacillus spathodeae TaxID=1465502 RepID=UPI001962137B
MKALIPFNILRLMSAVYYNGAYGRDFNGETFSRTIPAALSAKIIDTICRLGKRNTLSIESEDTLYALTNEIYEQNLVPHL